MKSETLIKVTCFFVLSEIIYQVTNRIYKKFKSACDSKSLTYSLKQLYDEPNDKSAHFNKVIFFPDRGLACRRMLSGRICHDKHCSAVHEKTSLSVLLNILNLSQRTLDVCVYMITCSILGDALVDCQRRGIVLRIITEERNSGEEGEMSGSQIGKLRAAGKLCANNSIYTRYMNLRIIESLHILKSLHRRLTNLFNKPCNVF